MAKDKKAKAAQKKARVAAKTEKKATQKEKKSKTKTAANNDDSDADDADLDAILADYAKKQEQYLKVTETVLASPPPSRSSATLLPNPSDSREVLLFGGEALRNGLASFSNELFVYRPGADQWRLVTSPNSPLPRSGHAWCRGANTGLVYLFGGEFSSPKQGTFYHYNDFWALNPGSREWMRLEAGKVSPSARSGHRMVSWKRYVLLFGGFQDTSSSTKYLSDLWVYDTQNFTWHEPKLSLVAQKPDARSSFSFLPHENGAVLVGGYSRVKATATMAGGRKGKGGGGSRVVMKPVVHTDCWMLRITEPAKEDGEKALPTIRWERRKRPVNFPNPPRAGATMAHHKGRGILFGGVHDVEESEEGIESEFFNQLWAFNIDRNRFFPLSLRRPRQGQKKAVVQERARRGRGKADEEELLKNLALIENKGSLDDDGEEKVDSVRDDTPHSDEDEAAPVEKPVIYEMPHPRFNAQLAVQDDTLFIYGGTFEKGDLEFQMDELWAIDLGKMDGAKEIFRRDLEGWGEAESSDDEDDDDEEDEEDSEDEDEVKEDGEKAQQPTTPDKKVDVSQKQEEPEEEEEKEIKTSKDDGLPYPRPFESLRDFYARTTTEWQNIAIHAAQFNASASAEMKGAKELKKEAFGRAEQRWWDVREEIQALEDEREEGGIGDVVQLADRAAEGAGPRRR